MQKRHKSIVILGLVVDYCSRSFMIQTNIEILLNIRPKNKKYCQAPFFFALQLVINGRLVSVPGRTNRYLEESQHEYL